MTALLLFLHTTAYAVPVQMTHQGRLVDTTGAAYTGIQNLTFSLFDQESNGTVLWEEELVVSFNNGYYATVLGADSNYPLDSLILSQYPLYLEIQVGQGTPLSPRTPLQSVPYAQISGTAESVDGGQVVSTGITMRDSTGTEVPVINSQGQWVGPITSVNWNDIDASSIPADLADGDNDTQLTEPQVEGFITNGSISLAQNSAIQNEGLILSQASVIPWSQLDPSTIPASLADGDDDTLASLACSMGEVAGWDGSNWVCTSDNTLSMTELSTMLSSTAVDLHVDSTLGGLAILTSADDMDTLASLSCVNDGEILRYDLATSSWYCDTESSTSPTDVINAIESANSLTLPSSTTLNGQGILTAGSTLSWNQLDESSIPAGLSDGDDVLSESTVENMVTNSSLNLAANTTVDGEMIVTTPPSCQDGQILSFDAASSMWNCIDFVSIIDQDSDGVLAWNDCDDSNSALLAQATDQDCDGIITSDDCDDNDASSTAISADADCDGFVTTTDCDDNNADITTSGRGNIQTCAATTCAEVLANYPSSSTGIYWISPDNGTAYQAYCEMSSDGGGWTLLGTVYGGDSNNWNSKFGNWSNTTAFGDIGSPFQDYKSEAWIDYDLGTAEIMVERRYDGVVRARSKLSNACLHNKSNFYQLFTTYDTSLRCGLSEVSTITPATSSAGLTAASYQEGNGSNGIDGSGTNGWCWNGGDNNSNIFQGHAGFNQSGYGCYDAGHLGYIGVFSNSHAQYSNEDITGTNWINGTNYALTGVSFYVR